MIENRCWPHPDRPLCTIIFLEFREKLIFGKSLCIKISDQRSENFSKIVHSLVHEDCVLIEKLSISARNFSNLKFTTVNTLYENF